MSKLTNTYKKRCSYCLKTIGKYQKSIECITCHKWFHATATCVKLCQKCLENYLPFQLGLSAEFRIFGSKSNIFVQETWDVAFMRRPAVLKQANMETRPLGQKWINGKVYWLRFRIVITQANIRFRPNGGEYSKFEPNRIVRIFATDQIVANIRNWKPTK